jgi:hypothetical protein
MERTEVDSVFRLQERIAISMQGGSSLDRVDRELIAPADLNEEQKAALWLYAHSLLDGRWLGVSPRSH